MDSNISEASSSQSDSDALECAICLQPCMHPVQLPCSHIFCFLCAKGTAMQSRRCALCRSAIPQNFISQPSQFVKDDDANNQESRSESTSKYVWFYQGYNGWWQYDDRTCTEIEAACRSNAKSVDVLIAGAVYVIDLENKVQYQRNRNSRKRKIKRDLVTAAKKGVAGLQSRSTDDSAELPCPANSETGSGSGDPTHDVNETLVPINQPSTNDALPQSSEQLTRIENPRQIPIGSEELLNNNTSATPIHSSLQVPNMARTSSENIGGIAVQNHVQPALCRYNTYGPSSSRDEQMDI